MNGSEELNPEFEICEGGEETLRNWGKKNIINKIQKIGAFLVRWEDFSRMFGFMIMMIQTLCCGENPSGQNF